MKKPLTHSPPATAPLTGRCPIALQASLLDWFTEGLSSIQVAHRLAERARI